MLKKIVAYLTGYVRFSTKDITRAQNVILHRRLICQNVKIKDGSLYFDVSLTTSKELTGLFEKYGIPIKIEKTHGLILSLLNYRKRVGLFLGALIFISMIFLSQNILWSVEVTSEEAVDSDLILENLEELGFSIGCYLPDKNVLAISNSYLLRHDELSYISINIIGNCAEVKVVPGHTDEKREQGSTPSSIIASRDGFIERVEVYSGQIIKGGGQTVQKGEVIVSGLVLDPSDQTYRLVRSKAKVFAKTQRTFTVSIPLEYTQITHSQWKSVDRSLCFFGKEINFSKNSCVSDNKYDIIRVDKPVILFGRIKLPIFIRTTSAALLSEETLLRSESQAAALAMTEISKIIEQSNVEILSISKSFHTENGCLVLVCRASCLEDIAVEIPMVNVSEGK